MSKSHCNVVVFLFVIFYHQAGFDILDAWDLTATRPDASYDGLHFRDCQQYLSTSDGLVEGHDENQVCIYRIMTQMFFNFLRDPADSRG